MAKCDSYIAKAALYFIFSISLLSHSTPPSIDPSIAKYLKIGVTEGVTYDILRIKGCPCYRDLYYEAYRKFFWKLGTERQ